MMGFIKWLIIGAIVALPVFASFAVMPSGPSPEGIGDYLNGIVQYWKEVISQIEIPSPVNNEPISDSSTIAVIFQ